MALPTSSPGQLPHRPSRPPGRPPGRQRLVEREAVLDTAEALIADDPSSLTMDRLARAVSVTKPSLYRVIGDREALVVALSDRFNHRVNVAAAQTVDPAATGRPRLRQVFGAYLSVVDEHRSLYIFVASAVAGRDRMAQLLEAAAGTAPELARHLSDLGVSSARADRWSYGIIGASLLMTLHWLQAGGRDIDEIAEDLTDLIWLGVSSSEVVAPSEIVGEDAG